MKSKDTGTLVLTVYKDREWIDFELANGEVCSILLRDAKCGNKKRVKTIIQCSKDIKINRRENEEMGNIK